MSIRVLFSATDKKRKTMERIVIIGGGPAGLTAAKEAAQRKNAEVVLLEQTSEFGGISRTVKTDGNRMDIGGHRFFSKDSDIAKMWTNVLPLQGEKSYDDKLLGRDCKVVPGGPDPEKTDDVMLIRHRVSRIYYKNCFFDYPVSMKWATIKNMGFFTTVRAGLSYLKSCVFKKKEDSLENFYINRFGKVLYEMFFKGYTAKLWGREPKEISAEWGAQRVKGLSVRALLKDMFSKVFKRKNREVETSLIEEFYYPKLGPGQLWEKVAKIAEDDGCKIIKNAKVTSFERDGNKIIAVHYEKDGKSERLAGDNFISSMPIKDLIDGLDCPTEVKEVAAGLPYRDFVTIGLLVDRLKLKNNTKIKTLGGIVPDCWIYVQDTSVKLGRIQIFNNWSPYMVKDAQNTVWLGLEYFCDEGDEFWNLSEEDTVKIAVDELIKIGIIDKSANVLQTHREKVQKAYPAYFDSYANFEVVKNHLNSIENLYCVGRNGQHRYNNMDHSMLTAYKVVNEINGLGKKGEEWEVNTEKAYHESK